MLAFNTGTKELRGTVISRESLRKALDVPELMLLGRVKLVQQRGVRGGLAISLLL